MNENEISYLKRVIHTVENYPIEGVTFRDVTSLMDDAEAFAKTIAYLKRQFKDQGFTKVVGTEARGFLFGAPLAIEMGVGFVPVRKPGKLPRETIQETYELEYGQDSLEIHKDALTPQDKVLIIDDLLATGGTIEATTKLIRALGAEAKHAGFVISLPELGGEERLEKVGIKSFSLLQY